MDVQCAVSTPALDAQGAARQREREGQAPTAPAGAAPAAPACAPEMERESAAPHLLRLGPFVDEVAHQHHVVLLAGAAAQQQRIQLVAAAVHVAHDDQPAGAQLLLAQLEVLHLRQRVACAWGAGIRGPQDAHAAVAGSRVREHMCSDGRHRGA